MTRKKMTRSKALSKVPPNRVIPDRRQREMHELLDKEARMEIYEDAWYWPVKG